MKHLSAADAVQIFCIMVWLLVKVNYLQSSPLFNPVSGDVIPRWRRRIIGDIILAACGASWHSRRKAEGGDILVAEAEDLHET